MMRKSLVAASILSVLLGLGITAAPRSAGAAEPAREFLDALRENKYNDMALLYLERMSKSPLAPVELKEVMDYERGVTLMEASRAQRDNAIREKQLDEAQAAFETFLKQRANHKLADQAKSELGNLLVERARMKIEQSKKGNKQERLTESRQLYDNAYEVFGKLKEDLKTRLSRLPKVIDPKNTQQKELIEQLRRDYLQVQLLEAAVREETADTVTEGSDEYKKLITEAEKLYAEVYEKYRTMIAGLYARMYQGRTTQKLGKPKDAISFYIELLEQPDNPEAFRDVKTKTLKLAVDSWRAEGQFAEAIRQYDEWIKKARPNEARSPDYMELRMTLAKLNIDYADKLKEKDPRDAQIGPLLRDAKTLAQFVARYPNELQQDARRLLAEVGGGPAVADDRPEPKTFDEARTAGRESLGAMQTAEQVLKVLPPRLAQEKDPTVKSELEKQLEEAKQTVNTAKADALRYFNMALKLADQETETEDLNIVRYFLCYLHFIREDYYDAAVLGEFVARRSPLSSAARQCAKIAMASYLKLYAASQDAEKSFESNRIVAICDYITKQWSDQPEAIDALNTLIPFMIKNGELDRALGYLASIPETAPQRGAAELKTGQALWSGYLLGMQQVREWKADPTSLPADTDMAAKEAELVALKKQAEKTLADGIGRMQQAGSIDETIATAVLSLAQLYVDTEQAPKAVTMLEEPKIGALTLVKAKHPATRKPGFSAETYKTALRAYIASLAAPDAKGDQLIEKATDMMDALKADVGETAAGQQRLVAIYLSLAKDLESQMKLIGSAEAKTAMSKGFETFLKQVSSQSTEFNIVYWVAETFRGMAEAFDDGRAGLSPEAVRYYTEAINTYQSILDRGKSTPAWIQPGQMKLQIQLQVAATNRRMGKFQEAVNVLESILRENNMMLAVQIEAAKTYQQWAGDRNAKPEMYNLALQGARKDEKTGKNLIWGWNRISEITANKEAFTDAFHEARLNMAKCHYEHSLRKQAKAEQTALLERAKRSILLTSKLFPDMGGEKWQPQYDELVRNIQDKLGEKRVGLAAFQDDRAPAGG